MSGVKMLNHIIMNPPYDKNLHLKILQEAIKHSDDVVNLSPIRWLQDPLAEYKKNSDWKKFEDIRAKIEDVDTIKAEDATVLFQALMHSDLGIYHITKEGGYIVNRKYKSIIEKVLVCPNHWEDVAEQEKVDGIRVKTQRLRNSAPSSNGPIKQYVKDESSYHLMYKRHSCIFIDGKQNGKWWTEFDIKNKYSRKVGDPFVDSIKFNTIEEAKNFEDSCWTKFMLFCNKISKVGVHTDFRFLPFLQDYTHPWTDEMLYEYFDLTPEEVNEIEQCIK